MHYSKYLGLLILSGKTIFAQVELSKPTLSSFELSNAITATLNDANQFEVSHKNPYDSTYFVFDAFTKVIQSPIKSYTQEGVIKYTAETDYERGFDKLAIFDLCRGYYHGKVVTYYDNGQVRDSGSYSYGAREGLHTFHYASGVLINETNYANGKKHGKALEYHLNGRLIEEKHFWYGTELFDNKTWNEHGDMVYERISKPVKTFKQWDWEGNLTSLYIEDSVYKSWSYNGSWFELKKEKELWVKTHYRKDSSIHVVEPQMGFLGPLVGERYIYDEKGILLQKEKFEVINSPSIEMDVDDWPEAEKPFNYKFVDPYPQYGNYRDLSEEIYKKMQENKVKWKAGTYPMIVQFTRGQKPTVTFVGLDKRSVKFSKSKAALFIADYLQNTSWRPAIINEHLIFKCELKMDLILR